MKLTLAVIVYWLSVNFDLPTNYDLPRIEHASADKMLELRYQGLATPRAAKAGSLGACRRALRQLHEDHLSQQEVVQPNA